MVEKLEHDDDDIFSISCVFFYWSIQIETSPTSFFDLSSHQNHKKSFSRKWHFHSIFLWISLQIYTELFYRKVVGWQRRFTNLTKFITCILQKPRIPLGDRKLSENLNHLVARASQGPAVARFREDMIRSWWDGND